MQAVTGGDVWQMFQEMIRENREWAREDRERWAELDRKFQETDQQMKATDQRMRETDRKIEAVTAQMKATDQQIKATDQQMKATDQQMKATALKIEKIGDLVDKLGGRLGEFVEGLVAPACEKLFTQVGIPVHQVSRRLEATLPGNRRMEIDLFVVNTDAVVLVEVKSKLTVDDVREHLARLAEFKEFFPKYANESALGAVAGMVVAENVRRFSIKNGLFVIVQTGDTVRLANEPAFKPRAW